MIGTNNEISKNFGNGIKIPVNVHIMAKSSCFRLTKSIAVDDGTQVVEFVMRRVLHSLPDGTFCTFAITHHAVDAVWSLEVPDKSLVIALN